MLRRILVPLDGSSTAERALPLAAALARAFLAEVIVLRVVESSPDDVGRGWTDPVGWRLGRAEALSYLERIAERLRSEGIEPRVEVGVGAAAEEILETARARGVDLIALTTHGRGGPTEFALAGTAHKIATGSNTSILLVPAGEGRPAHEGVGRIVVPLDGSQRGGWALCFATGIARAEGAELILAHVVQAPEPLRIDGDERVDRLREELIEASCEVAEGYLAEVGRKLGAEDLTIRTRVAVGASAARAIERIAEEEAASLVVLSAHGRSARPGCAYGTVPFGLVDRVQRPLLVLRDPGGPQTMIEPRFASEAGRRPTGRRLTRRAR